MTLSLVVMGSSADRSAADVAIPIAVGETTVSGNGAPGTGTQWYPKAPGAICGAFVNSETAAMVETWFNKTTDINRNKLSQMHLQTIELRAGMINHLNYPISNNDAVQAAGQNGGAVMDALGLYVSKGGYELPPTATPRGPLPAGAITVRATSTFTHVADSLAEGTLVFDDFTPERDQWYKIIGMAADSATGLATRLNFLEGVNVDDYPGVPTADTSSGDLYQMWYGDFGTFRGQTLPNVQTIAIGADSVTNLYFVLVPTGRGTA